MKSLFSKFAYCLLLSASVFQMSCATSGTKKSEKAPLSFPIIDGHLHTNFDGKPNRFSGIVNSRESLENEMKANGVVGAISHTKSAFIGYYNGDSTNVVHCAGVTDTKDISGEVEKGLKAKQFRCIKIYLGYIFRYATDPYYEKYYKLAAKYRVPVVFHTGDTSDVDAMVKYSEPMAIDEVAVKHRNVTFVIAHLGNPWIETASEIAYKNANVYVDVSAFLVGNFKDTKQETMDEYITKPVAWAWGYIDDPKKMIYGTDWPLTAMGPYIEAIKKAIPPNHWPDVFYKNAQRVFKIPGLPEIVDSKKE